MSAETRSQLDKETDDRERLKSAVEAFREVYFLTHPSSQLLLEVGAKQPTVKAKLWDQRRQAKAAEQESLRLEVLARKADRELQRKRKQEVVKSFVQDSHSSRNLDRQTEISGMPLKRRNDTFAK